MMELVHLSLHKLVEKFYLSGHDLGQIWWGWWRLLGTAGLICPETFRGSASSSNHLKQGDIHYQTYPYSYFQMIYSCQNVIDKLHSINSFQTQGIK
jgi:hypothetical protein